MQSLSRLGSLERLAFALTILAAPAAAQETTRVSVDSSGAEGNYSSGSIGLSADGQIVAFVSYASNLVAGDTNGTADVFIHDRTTGITERVSVDSSGTEGNADSPLGSISADGQVLAFVSYASNLVAGDTNGTWDVFVHDRTTGITERVSVDSSGAEANSYTFYTSISADGRIVAFASWASNLVAGDTNGTVDVFVHDRSTGITELVSVDSSGAHANASSLEPSISADGQVVAFASSSWNLVAGDTNGIDDVFVHDRATGITERMSVSSSGAEGNSSSDAPSISADGQIVAFVSYSSNLVAGDTNHEYDVFVHDRETAITERVSVNSSGADGNDLSDTPSISADGQIVAFESLASNLVAGDANGTYDVFTHDLTTGITERVSVDSSGAEGNDSSLAPSISADGNVLAFGSLASDLVLGDTNGWLDAFVHERCSITASWTNYGSGFPGTNGIPSLASQQNPSFGTTVILTLTNLLGAPTSGLLLIGFQRGSFNTRYGGQVLVLPSVIAPISFSYGADSFTGTIPDDLLLCGVTVDVQGIEADPGATSGVSFSPGLELLLGH